MSAYARFAIITESKGSKMNKYKTRKCSIETSAKQGRTRLHLSNLDVESFLDDCVYTDEDKEETRPPSATNPIYHYQ